MSNDKRNITTQPNNIKIQHLDINPRNLISVSKEHVINIATDNSC